jgi:DNA polymerase-3 subunit delta
MSVTAQRALRSAIDGRKFDPVYYLHGDDEYRKDEAVARLIAAAVDAATRDFNLDVLRGADVDAERLGIALTSLPMLAERRVVVLRDVGALKKPARAQLDRYLRSPASETLLVLTSPAGDEPDTAIVGCTTAVPFAKLSGEKLLAWLVQHARRDGIELSGESAALIVEGAGGDLNQAAAELEKLVSYVNGRPITVSDVEAVVGVRRDATMADLLNAVAERDGARACALVEPVMAQPKTTGVQVVMYLATQAVAMAYGRAALAGGLPASRLETEFFGLLKLGRGSPGRPWGDAVKCWARNLSRWSAADLAAAIRSARAADLALKDTRVSSEEAVISSLVLALCIPSEIRESA